MILLPQVIAMVNMDMQIVRNVIEYFDSEGRFRLPNWMDF